MTYKLHSVKGKKTKSGGNIYCGPTAIMAITGKEYPEVQAACNSNRFRKPTAPILGLDTSALRGALYDLGYRATKLSSIEGEDYKGKTIAKVLRERKDKRYFKQPIIIMTRNHYVTVLGRKFIDSHTREPVWIKQAPHRRARVKQIYLIEKII